MSDSETLVGVIDDDASMRAAIERLLRSIGLTAVTYPDAKAFLDRDAAMRPACLVLDVRMPEMSGLDLQDFLTRAGEEIPIVFITGFGSVPSAVRAMKGGAIDFLAKPFDDQDLIDAVHRGIEASRARRRTQSEEAVVAKRLDLLTPREREIFEGVVAGRLNKQIAFDLGIAEKTVKVHRARVMEKLAVESLADLVRLAERAGIGRTR